MKTEELFNSRTFVAFNFVCYHRVPFKRATNCFWRFSIFTPSSVTVVCISKTAPIVTRCLCKLYDRTFFQRKAKFTEPNAHNVAFALANRINSIINYISLVSLSIIKECFKKVENDPFKLTY